MKTGFYDDKKGSGRVQDQDLGLIHVCHGQGVGKTTRSIGLSIRAAGAGLEVTFVQFLKSGDSSETEVFARIPNIHYRCPGPHPFIMSQGPEPLHFQHAETALGYALEAAAGPGQVLVCDEILTTPLFGVLEVGRILDLMDRCRGRVELVMTGVEAPPEVVAKADYVTRFVQEKHPFYDGHA
ncbi:MAG: cob(I)yrinic acid a,c-diamide adenosyltransferase, partial [Proteobacteria bacterium]|nr:cob(I)yrinic acid a,c-diamide adenosyltransferase [Pseudomonadota bacterium]